MSHTENNPAEPGPEAAVPAPVIAAEEAAAAAPEAAAPAEPAAPTEPAAPAAPAIPELSPVACAAKLAELFPALFGAGRALPIKLRIQADIQQRAPGLFTKKSLSIFLHRHTTSTAYLKALAQAPARLDLDGQPAGDIAQEHRDAAATELARRLAIVQERRAAERKAQRQGAAPQGAAAEGGAAQPQAPRGERPPRPERGPRPERPNQGPRPDRPPRPPRPEGAPRGDRPPRPDRPPHPDRPPRGERPPRPAAPFAQATQPVQAAAPAPVPRSPEEAAQFEARRQRANLLRAYETTTLTRANFLALKGMSDTVLEEQLVQARAERGERPPLKPERPGPTRR